MIPHGWFYHIPYSDRTYCVAVMMQHLLSVVAPESNWKTRFLSLFDQFPHIDVAHMGFPENWRNRPPWDISARAASAGA